jgi:hypothetical protein
MKGKNEKRWREIEAQEKKNENYAEENRRDKYMSLVENQNKSIEHYRAEKEIEKEFNNKKREKNEKECRYRFLKTLHAHPETLTREELNILLDKHRKESEIQQKLVDERIALNNARYKEKKQKEKLEKQIIEKEKKEKVKKVLLHPFNSLSHLFHPQHSQHMQSKY